jgi:formate hydrogenlyase transcriptional activator
VSRVLGAYRDPKELFRILADELKRTVDFNFVGLFLYDESSNTVHNPLLETMGGRGFAIPANFPAEDTITWWVYRHRKPVVISSRDEEKRFPRMMELYRHYAVESACVLPLTTAHRRLGSLGFAA